MAESRLTVRVDQEVRDGADAVLAGLGMSLSGAVEVFLRQVVADGGLPFRPSLAPEAAQRARGRAAHRAAVVEALEAAQGTWSVSGASQLLCSAVASCQGPQDVSDDDPIWEELAVVAAVRAVCLSAMGPDGLQRTPLSPAGARLMAQRAVNEVPDTGEWGTGPEERDLSGCPKAAPMLERLAADCWDTLSGVADAPRMAATVEAKAAELLLSALG